jgi:hypothetical protein
MCYLRLEEVISLFDILRKVTCGEIRVPKSFGLVHIRPCKEAGDAAQVL